MTTAESSIIRILLVDDHAILRAGLRMLLEDQPTMKVIGEAANRDEALALTSSEQPDVILLDLDLGGTTSLEFLPELRQIAVNTRIIILTGVQDGEQHHRAIECGALGLVLKDQASNVLVKAVEKVYAGEVWLDRTFTASTLTKILQQKNADNNPVSARLFALTRREREIILLVAQGQTRRQIATQLFISEATVRNHLTAILGKLELSNSFEIAMFAYRHGLAKPPGD